jgi:hypothetical protein
MIYSPREISLKFKCNKFTSFNASFILSVMNEAWKREPGKIKDFYSPKLIFQVEMFM